MARMASTACSRGIKYSDCNSLPALGVKPILKCGKRSYQGPGIPNCSVQFSGESSAIGCKFLLARLAPKNVGGPSNEFCESTRLLIQTSFMRCFCQSVKRLTL